MKPQAKGWSEERRKQQAELIRRWRPWERSTGPRTPKGKSASSRNATKSSPFTQALLDITRAVRRAKREANKVG